MTLLVLVVFVAVVATLLLTVSALLAPHRPDGEKVSAYETGLLALLGQTRAPFTVSFYLTAVLFLLFDLEVAFIYPATVTLEALGLYGYWVLCTFFLLLTAGFILELGTGVLDLTSGATAIHVRRASASVSTSTSTSTSTLISTLRISTSTLRYPLMTSISTLTLMKTSTLTLISTLILTTST
jgi:NADH:ubiquinone oxidoreductase subunit 3 (subunit A)